MYFSPFPARYERIREGGLGVREDNKVNSTPREFEIGTVCSPWLAKLGDGD